MSERENPLKAVVTYKDLKVEFTGSPDMVLLSINDFVAKNVPSMDLASKITVNYSLKDLLTMFEAFVRLTPEGPRVWHGERKLSDKNLIALQLVAARIARESAKSSKDSMTLAQIQSATGLRPKSISSRLSELFKIGYVDREGRDDGVAYRITTHGINWLSSSVTKIATKS